jgi:hypothetical protein
MTMSGRYNIERGSYTFTFQSIKRNFTLREEAGSYISWNGDPSAATIDIEAEYEAENVRFSDLLSNSRVYILTSSLTQTDRLRAEANPLVTRLIHKPLDKLELDLIKSEAVGQVKH